MLQTSIYVGESLLHGASLLLPMVHSFFDKLVHELITASQSNLHDNVDRVITSQWILSNLATGGLAPSEEFSDSSYETLL